MGGGEGCLGGSGGDVRDWEKWVIAAFPCIDAVVAVAPFAVVAEGAVPETVVGVGGTDGAEGA